MCFWTSDKEILKRSSGLNDFGHITTSSLYRHSYDPLSVIRCAAGPGQAGANWHFRARGGAHRSDSLLCRQLRTTNRQGCVWKHVLIPDTTTLYLGSHAQSTATVSQCGCSGRRQKPASPNKQYAQKRNIRNFCFIYIKCHTVRGSHKLATVQLSWATFVTLNDWTLAGNSRHIYKVQPDTEHTSHLKTLWSLQLAIKMTERVHTNCDLASTKEKRPVSTP